MAGHRFNPKKADKLVDPKRKELINPEKIIELLEVKEGDIVADLGAGNGFLTIPMAEKTNETVYAVDIEPQMLELLKERANDFGVKDIHTVVSDLEEIKLENQTVNKVVVAFVLHEVPNLTKALDEMKRILKENGKVLILEWEAVESESGPPLHERIPSDKLANTFEENGYEVTTTHLHESVYALLCIPKKL